ncbi:sulfurtransferase [Xenorhabdus santafensis]|nr:sulfurtransferase [Xenorhabdus sp. 12]
MEGNLVSTDWLSKHIDDPNIIILDATSDSVHDNNTKTNNKAYIPGSLFFDLKGKFSDPDSALVHTAPTYDHFRENVRKMGISSDDIVIIYDAKGIHFSPRAWWLFKLMGHEKVFVLDGGLKKWLAEGRHVDIAPKMPKNNSFWEGAYNKALIASKEEILVKCYSDSDTIIDVRSHERFRGAVAEPREGLRSGHIPNSINLPFEQLLDGCCYKPSDELKSIFTEKKIDLESVLYFYCGSGVTACIALLAAYQCGYKKVCLYDGSWAEWGAIEHLPIE